MRTSQTIRKAVRSRAERFPSNCPASEQLNLGRLPGEMSPPRPVSSTSTLVRNEQQAAKQPSDIDDLADPSTRCKVSVSSRDQVHAQVDATGGAFKAASSPHITGGSSGSTWQAWAWWWGLPVLLLLLSISLQSAILFGVKLPAANSLMYATSAFQSWRGE